MAVENCLIPGLRNLFSDTTIGDTAESVITKIASDTPQVASRRKQLSTEIKILEGALDVFRECEVAGVELMDMGT